MCNIYIDKKCFNNSCYSVGGFLSLRPEGKTVKGTITSPVFSGNEWKCMRFWYRIESGRDVQLRVFLNVSDVLQQLWTTSHRKTGWNFVQLPINAEGTTQVNIMYINLILTTQRFMAVSKTQCLFALSDTG